jgi:hypothetical protein
MRQNLKRLAAYALLPLWFAFCFVVILIVAAVDEAETAWEKMWRKAG